MWKQIFYSYFEDEEFKNYSFKIFQKLFSQFKSGKFKELTIEESFKDKNKFKELINQFVKEKIEKKEFSSSIIPTILKDSVAKNFYLDLRSSQYTMKEDEIYFWLFHITSGIFYKNYVFNIHSSKPEKWVLFLKKIKDRLSLYFLTSKENGVNKDMLKDYLGLKNLKIIFLEKGNLMIFYLLAFYAKIFLEKKETLEELGIDDSSFCTLVEFSQGSKNKIYFYTKINKFIEEIFYNKETSNKNFSVDFIIAISSLINYDKNYKDLSLKFIDDLLYYLLKYRRINGEILYKIIDLRISSLRNQKKITPFYKIDELITRFNKSF